MGIRGKRYGTVQVYGRGLLHLTVLIENMRREGFELMVGPPKVMEMEVDGERCEPYESVDIEVCHVCHVVTYVTHVTHATHVTSLLTAARGVHTFAFHCLPLHIEVTPLQPLRLPPEAGVHRCITVASPSHHRCVSVTSQRDLIATSP